MKPIYLDYNATTPLDPRVLEAMLPYFSEHFGNASSIDHSYGAEADRAVNRAREQIAELIGADPAEIVFTSGATEADNLALLGSAAHAGADSEIVVSAVEHPAVLEAAKSLGARSKVAPVKPDGRVDVAALQRLIGARTALVSVMTANNETGVIQPAAEIAAACRDAGIPFHTDAAQAGGRLRLDVAALDCDLLSLSGHKMYGPKGVGALYVRKRGRRAKLRPIVHGGSHERGLRAGTLNVPAIVGLGAAAELVHREGASDWQRERQLRQQLTSGLSHAEGMALNVEHESVLPQTVSVRLRGVNARALMRLLRDRVAVSSGSACSTLTSDPSHVLLAQGLTVEDAQSSIRISFGRFTTEDEIDTAAAALTAGASELAAVTHAA